MDRTIFAERLRAASVAARDFARSYILEPLPDEMLFRVRLNQSYDKNPLHTDERLYSEDSALNFTDKLTRCTEAEVVDLLLRDGRVPEWADVAVAAETGSHTIMRLLCCGRFTDNEHLLYHAKEGWPPFHAVSPALPLEYQNGQRFSIYSRSEVLSLNDVEMLKPHRDRVWFLELRGPACDDLTLSGLPQFPEMQVLDLAYTATTGSGLSALDRQPKLRVLKVFVLQTQPLDIERLPPLPLLNTLMVWNAPSLTFDFGNQLPKLPSLNYLDLQIKGVLKLDGSLPDSMSTMRLRASELMGTLKCSKQVEHLSLQFNGGDEAELANFLRLTKGVKFLNLSTTPVSDAFIKDLVDRWPLEYLEISGTKVSEELTAQLVQLRPKLRVFHHKTMTKDGSASPPSGV
jgi:hypothetical protein